MWETQEKVNLLKKHHFTLGANLMDSIRVKSTLGEPSPSHTPLSPQDYA